MRDTDAEIRAHAEDAAELSGRPRHRAPFLMRKVGPWRTVEYACGHRHQSAFLDVDLGRECPDCLRFPMRGRD